MKKITLSFVFACMTGMVFGQFFNGSQFQNLDTRLNPALTGIHAPGKIVMSTSLAPGSSTSYHGESMLAFSAAKILKSGDRIGFGGQAVYFSVFPKETALFSRSETELQLFGAYHKKINKNTEHPDYLSFGVAGGILRDFYENPSLTSEEQVSLFTNFNAGAAYLLNTSYGQWSFGASVRNIGEAEPYVLNKIWNLYVLGDFELTDMLGIKPRFIFTDHEVWLYNIFNIGNTFSVKINKNKEHFAQVGGGVLLTDSTFLQNGWYVNMGYVLPVFTVSMGVSRGTCLGGCTIYDLAFQYRFQKS